MCHNKILKLVNILVGICLQAQADYAIILYIYARKYRPQCNIS